MSLIQNTTPINAGQTWTSAVENVTRATQITGLVFTDQNGTLKIEQSGDGVHFDIIQSFNVTANIGLSIEVDVIAQFFQVVFTNTSGTNQTALRLYVDIRDPYGYFLQAAQTPSAGGSWAVLFLGPNGYQYVGRFNGEDGLAANGSAAISLNKGGQYASFPVVDATVSIETLITSSEHAIASF